MFVLRFSLATLTCMAGMFFEIPTIWKEKREESSSQSDTEPPPNQSIREPPPRIPWLQRALTGENDLSSKKQELANWRPRRIGIFFSQNDNPFQSNNNNNQSPAGEKTWTCLVLIEPIENFKNFVFCYRKKTVNENTVNARCLDGPARYTIEETDLYNTISHILQILWKRHFVEDLTSGPHHKCAKFLTELGKDVIWGWEEFTTQVVQFSAVPPLHLSLDSLGVRTCAMDKRSEEMGSLLAPFHLHSHLK
jgi:hypothetical protein